jgi:hypothetical protein
MVVPTIKNNWNMTEVTCFMNLARKSLNISSTFLLLIKAGWDRAHQYKKERYVAINTYNTVINKNLFREKWLQKFAQLDKWRFASQLRPEGRRKCGLIPIIP